MCVCVLVCLRRYIDFGRILRHDFFMPSCLNKLLASTVQRAIEVGHENLLCSLSSRIQELLFKHGANVRKNMKLELMTGKHLVQHIPKKWGRIERDVLRGFEIEIAKTQRNKELFFFVFSVAEHVYIEMLSLNSEVTRNTSSSKYDIK